jgi:hypothetical protein
MRRRHIASLFGGYAGEMRSVTVLPPLVRRFGPLGGRLYKPLAALPFLRTHYLALLRKPH